jgi:hypothetical protein
MPYRKPNYRNEVNAYVRITTPEGKRKWVPIGLLVYDWESRSWNYEHEYAERELSNIIVNGRLPDQ